MTLVTIALDGLEPLTKGVVRMRMTLIAIVKPRLIQGGRPTPLTRRLMRTPRGRALVRYMFAFYVAAIKREGFYYYDLDTSLDIKDYRILGKDEDDV